MPSHFRLLCGSALGLALVLSGCSSSTEPATFADPLKTAAQAAALDSALTADAVVSFQALSGSMQASPQIVQRAAGMITTLRLTKPDGSRYTALASQAHALRQVVPAFASIAATGLIPDTLLGAVFSWDANTGSYYRSSKTGGPSDGIRFLLYAINQFTGAPATPLNQIGYADLRDTGTGGTAQLTIDIKSNDGLTTYLHYVFTGSGSSSSFTATVTGFVSNGLGGSANKTLNFSFSVTGTSSSVTVSTTYSLNNPSVTAQETVTVADDGSTTTLTIHFTLTGNGESVSVDGTIAISDTTGDGTVDIRFTINGHPFASITGTLLNPTVTRAAGGSFTANESLAVEHLFLAASTLSEEVTGLFDPAQRMLGF